MILRQQRHAASHPTPGRQTGKGHARADPALALTVPTADAASASAKRSRDQLHATADPEQAPAQPNAKRPYLSNALSNAAATEGLEAQLLRLADAAAAAGAADEAQHRQQAVAAAAAVPDAGMYSYDDETQDDAPFAAGGGAYAAAVPLPPHAAAAAGAPVKPGNLFAAAAAAAAAGGVFHPGAGGMTVGQACELPSLHLKVALRTWAKLRFPGHHRDSGDHVLITDLLPDCSCYLTYLRQAVDRGLKAITARK